MLSADDWASVEVVVKLGGGNSSQAAAKWQAEHKHLQRSNSSSVSLTLPFNVRGEPLLVCSCCWLIHQRTFSVRALCEGCKMSLTAAHNTYYCV